MQWESRNHDCLLSAAVTLPVSTSCPLYQHCVPALPCAGDFSSRSWTWLSWQQTPLFKILRLFKNPDSLSLGSLTHQYSMLSKFPCHLFHSKVYYYAPGRGAPGSESKAAAMTDVACFTILPGPGWPMEHYTVPLALNSHLFPIFSRSVQVSCKQSAGGGSNPARLPLVGDFCSFTYETSQGPLTSRASGLSSHWLMGQV